MLVRLWNKTPWSDEGKLESSNAIQVVWDDRIRWHCVTRQRVLLPMQPRAASTGCGTSTLVRGSANMLRCERRWSHEPDINSVR
eukprot:501839-Rhodomonas_salina.3